ncbi:hypothetical protein MC885_012032, partial [Smutsia gigantea]
GFCAAKRRGKGNFRFRAQRPHVFRPARPRAARIRRRCFGREWVGEKPGQGRSRRSCRSRDTQGSLTQKPQGMLVESLIPPPKLLFQAAPWALIQKATSESRQSFQGHSKVYSAVRDSWSLQTIQMR